MASRPPLGIALSDQLGAAQPKPMSHGQIILGILADALSGAAGHQGQFAQMLQKRQDDAQEQAQWSLRNRAELQRELAVEDYKRTHPEPSSIERDAAAWQAMTPDQRTAYQQVRQAGAGDPDVVVSLPNGQVYAGPRSGLAAALAGGAAAAAPQRPAIGSKIPLDGGPTPPASGGFLGAGSYPDIGPYKRF